MTELIGMALGQYHILEEIGRGGMGTVYKGYDTALKREVAIKVLAPHLVWEKGFVERFLREARAAAKLDHPHIVTIYNVGQQADLYYFVMQYLEGQTLAEIIQQQGALPLSRVTQIVEQVASALDYAHAQGLVHRDIKPGNIIINPTGQVTLTDFGIAKAAEGTALTGTGTLIGTPQYMAPEQVRGQKVSPQTDIYALGVVCYEMLTGRVPFGDDTPAILHAHVYEPPPPLRSMNPRVPVTLEPVIGRALAKKAAERHQSAGELARALAMAASGVAPPAAMRPEPARRRFPPALIWGLGIGLAVVIIACVVLVSGLSTVLTTTKATPTPAQVAVWSATPTATVPLAAILVPPTAYPTYTPYPTYTLVPTDTPVPPTPTPIIIVVTGTPLLATDTPILPTLISWAEASPEQAVRDYYLAINNRQYQRTWGLLSSHFKDLFNCCKPDGSYDFDSYVEWWDSVAQVSVGEVRVIAQDGSTAIVIADLWYLMRDGRMIPDANSRIQLVWDATNRAWLFYNKGP